MYTFLSVVCGASLTLCKQTPSARLKIIKWAVISALTPASCLVRKFQWNGSSTHTDRFFLHKQEVSITQSLRVKPQHTRRHTYTHTHAHTGLRGTPHVYTAYSEKSQTRGGVQEEIWSRDFLLEYNSRAFLKFHKDYFSSYLIMNPAAATFSLEMCKDGCHHALGPKTKPDRALLMSET